MSTTSSIKRNVSIIFIFSIISKLFGFLRQFVLANYFGASVVSDVYLVSLSIPDFLIGFLVSAIFVSFIPIRTKVVKQIGEDEANKFTSNFINIVLIITTCLVIISFILTNYLVKFFAIGFFEDSLDLAINFTKITVFGMYFSVLVAVFSAYLQMKNNFVIPASLGIILNIVVIISIIVAASRGIINLAIGFVVAGLIQFIFLIIFVKKYNFRYYLKCDFKDENIKQIYVMALPLMIGLSLHKVNMMVDKTIASTIVSGGITVLNYAVLLNGMLIELIVGPINTASFPVISSCFRNKELKKMLGIIKESINTVILIMLPVAIVSMIFSKSIVSLLFARGKFDTTAVLLTSNSLFYYSMGLISLSIVSILHSGFYATENTKTPMIMTVTGLIINVILNFILSNYMGLSGIALASSISITVVAILLLIFYTKKFGKINTFFLSTDIFKLLFAATCMGIVAKTLFYIMHQFSNFDVIAFIVSAVFSVITYFILIYFMNIKEFRKLVYLFKTKVCKKRNI